MSSRENDKAMDGLLRRSLARDEALRGTCPGPESLAAYYDRSLGETELAEYDLHFSQCAGCREQLAMMARAAAETDVALDLVPAAVRSANPLVVASPRGVAAPVESRAPSAAQPRRRILELRWLMPVAVLVLSTLVFMRFASRGNRAGVGNQVAMSTPAPARQEQREAEPAAGKLDAPKKTSETAKASDANEAPRSTLSATRSAKPSASNSAHAIPPGAAARASRPDASSRSNMRAGMAESARVHSSASETDVAESAPSEPPPELNAALPSIVVATDAATPPPPPAPTAQSSTGSARAMNGLGFAGRSSRGAVTRSATAATKSAGGRTAPLVIPTPDSTVLYRIVSGGFVERSQDRGATWQGQLLDSSAELRAASAPAPVVCWVVGRAGVVFITDDGKNWRNVSIPGASDLTSVDAKDELSATVSATDGQKWSTEDGGKTWTLSK